jgi:predicted nuclease with RNAse H fold
LPPDRFAGVDVGARKGFDVAAIDRDGVVAPPERLPSVGLVVAWLLTQTPRLVGVDSPRRAAPDGARSRRDERELALAVCGIRYTPDAVGLDANRDYYAWIRHGFALFAALEQAGVPAIECFPTATWTRLGGPRGTRSRAAWSRRVLARQGLTGVPARTNQDARDAIGAALTARLHDAGATERFGEIVVPASTALSCGSRGPSPGDPPSRAARARAARAGSRSAGSRSAPAP